MSLHIINSDFGLYEYFKVASNLHRNLLTSPEGALYKLNIIRLDVYVSNWIAQISKSCSLQRWEIPILLKCWSVLTKIHTPLQCRSFRQKLEPKGSHLLLGAASPIQACDPHLNIICDGLCCLFQKSVLICHLCFSIPWYSGETCCDEMPESRNSGIGSEVYFLGNELLRQLNDN
jgi:hypothetical protein